MGVTDLKPQAGFVLIKPIHRSEAFAAEVLDRSGLLLTDPKFEGRPQFGIITHVGDDVELAVGQKVIIPATKQGDFDTVRGFKYEGQRFFRIKADLIPGIITNEQTAV